MKARIEKLKLIPENPYHYKAVLERFEGKEVEVTIEEWLDNRTTAQNRYLWAYYTLISTETGDDANSLHELFKRQFLAPRFIVAMGQTVKIPGSTAKLSKKEFSEYIMRIEAETSITFPYREEL